MVAYIFSIIIISIILTYTYASTETTKNKMDNIILQILWYDKYFDANVFIWLTMILIT